MQRRDFMKVGGLGVATLASGTGYKGFSEETADKNLRVGLIGTGWYDGQGSLVCCCPWDHRVRHD